MYTLSTLFIINLVSDEDAVNEIGLPHSFRKHDLINVDLAVSNRELSARLPPYDSDLGSNQLSTAHIIEFRKICQLYLNFKQKENFLKLQKLRESQANLPVAQHRYGKYMRITSS